jgi:hypothetical protein
MYQWMRTEFAPSRGILCNVWNRQWNFITQSGDILNYNIDYYFSIPEWNLVDQAYTGTVPVRLHFYGTRFNATDSSTTATDQYYEFIDFIVGQPQVCCFTQINT